MMNFRHSFFSVLLLLTFHANGLSQQCDMIEVPDMPTGFNDSVKIRSVYDSVLNDISGNFTFLLINSYGQVQKRKAYLLTLDSTGSLQNGYEIIEDISGVVCKETTITRKLNSPPTDTLRLALFLGSSSTGTTHMSSTLLVSNRKLGIRMEYRDLDGDGYSCVGKSLAPPLMRYAAETLMDIFESSLLDKN